MGSGVDEPVTVAVGGGGAVAVREVLGRQWGLRARTWLVLPICIIKYPILHLEQNLSKKLYICWSTVFEPK